ncbi:19733_t:CDS:1 [Cetraspora pellucida]|uniref:19733_t:CDS:1 n=1 Tax=Cetraspora pellucida TaxID=1433469 RepID=A0A9N9PB72_9GLOM|nr:19733_t:CDS:1 [Cetraspora pellucida]
MINNEYLKTMMLKPKNVILEPKDNIVLELEDDIVLEPKDDIVLKPKNVDLDRPEFDNTDDNNKSLQSSMLLQTGNQLLVKKKFFKKLDSSSVKLFYKTKLVNNLDFWFCHYKSCNPYIKY